jgi:hypothetical protein
MHNCKSYGMKSAIGLGLLTLGFLAPIGRSQDRDRDRDRYWDANRNIYTRLEPGMEIPIRLNETIDVQRRDNRVYYGIVDRDIRGDNGRLALARGSQAELMVRVAPDNDLILDLESVTVNGQRYAIRTDRNRIESQPNLVGTIFGAVTNSEVRGRAVRVPRDSVVNFRLQAPLEVGVEDRGVTRDGHHYHDWYDHRQQ